MNAVNGHDAHISNMQQHNPQKQKQQQNNAVRLKVICDVYESQLKRKPLAKRTIRVHVGDYTALFYDGLWLCSLQKFMNTNMLFVVGHEHFACVIQHFIWRANCNVCTFVCCVCF